MKKQETDHTVKEALNGFIVGLMMMIVVFLFVHYILGIQAFS
ncbi:hypothetical protein [Bacillus sp. FJAT-45350]|nr:hypothetical protein [Bacillus sp. FJAT-45350]